MPVSDLLFHRKVVLALRTIPICNEPFKLPDANHRASADLPLHVDQWDEGDVATLEERVVLDSEKVTFPGACNYLNVSRRPAPSTALATYDLNTISSLRTATQGRLFTSPFALIATRSTSQTAKAGGPITAVREEELENDLGHSLEMLRALAGIPPRIERGRRKFARG